MFNGTIAGGKGERFKKVYSQGTIAVVNEIWVDTVTGVNYLFHRDGSAAGFCPLLNGEGKPVVTSPEATGNRIPKKE
jgi:hypothetical protein